MRKSYHICVSGGDEVIFRSTEDYYHAFNCLALASYGSDSSLLAEAIMSTHSHFCARTQDPAMLIHDFRYPYARYFNNKYSRRGRLGERNVFIIELEGLYHHLSALAYVLRNPVHHGVSPTPFAYPHSSACAFFRTDLGRDDFGPVLHPRYYKRFLPYMADYPETYKMNSSGVFLRESVLDVADVEHMFSSPRAYQYYMNRLSGEEWKREQEKDNNDKPPVTLASIEQGVSMNSLEIMMANENGRADYNVMTDISLCEFIDKELLPKYSKESVYLLSRVEKEKLGNYLCSKFRLSRAQVARCIAYK